jgi:hypothetical protein
VHTISPEPRGLAVDVSFRSRQAANLGPDNETCTLWRLQYNLIADGGDFKLLNSMGALHDAC